MNKSLRELIQFCRFQPKVFDQNSATLAEKLWQEEGEGLVVEFAGRGKTQITRRCADMKQTQPHGDVTTRRLPESLTADGSEETQSRFLLLAQNKIQMKGCRRTKHIQSFCPRPPSSLDLGGESFQSVFESREQRFFFFKKRRKN